MNIDKLPEDKWLIVRNSQGEEIYINICSTGVMVSAAYPFDNIEAMIDPIYSEGVFIAKSEFKIMEFLFSGGNNEEIFVYDENNDQTPRSEGEKTNVSADSKASPEKG